MGHKWTTDELIAIIKSIKSTDFKVEDVNVDLHKLVAAAIAKGHGLVTTCEKASWTSIRI